MEPGTFLPIMKLTRSAKRNIAFCSLIMGVATTVVTYKSTTHIMNGVLESVGVRLYEDLGVVLRKNR